MKLVHATRPTFRRVNTELDRFFDRVLPEQFWGNRLDPVEQATEWMPAYDVAETDAEYIVRLEAPGIHRENLDVKLTGDLLTITGKRERMEHQRGETYLWQEREIGDFMRTLRLPAPVVEAEVEAMFEDGILSIRLPKVAKAIENKISIK